MVYPNSGRPQFIRAYYGCYDPLSYLVLYPGGETGWEDKSILLEETPIVRFPRNRRKYTKRKSEGMTSICPCQQIYIFWPVYGNNMHVDLY